jgi:hypothetical protein
MGMSAAERQALHRKRVKERMRELQEVVARLREMCAESALGRA